LKASHEKKKRLVYEALKGKFDEDIIALKKKKLRDKSSLSLSQHLMQTKSAKEIFWASSECSNFLNEIVMGQSKWLLAIINK
jgi:hypothetical protein